MIIHCTHDTWIVYKNNELGRIIPQVTLTFTKRPLFLTILAYRMLSFLLKVGIKDKVFSPVYRYLKSTGNKSTSYGGSMTVSNSISGPTNVPGLSWHIQGPGAAPPDLRPPKNEVSPVQPQNNLPAENGIAEHVQGPPMVKPVQIPQTENEPPSPEAGIKKQPGLPELRSHVQGPGAPPPDLRTSEKEQAPPVQPDGDVSKTQGRTGQDPVSPPETVSQPLETEKTPQVPRITEKENPGLPELSAHVQGPGSRTVRPELPAEEQAPVIKPEKTPVEPENLKEQLKSSPDTAEQSSQQVAHANAPAETQKEIAAHVQGAPATEKKTDESSEEPVEGLKNTLVPEPISNKVSSIHINLSEKSPNLWFSKYAALYRYQQNMDFLTQDILNTK